MTWEWTYSAWTMLGAAAGLSGLCLYFSRQQSRCREELANSRREAQALQATFDSFDHPLIHANREGIIVRWNAAAERLYGYAAKDMLNQPLSAMLPPERRGEIYELVHKVSKSEQALRVETVIPSKTGQAIDVALTFTPVKDEARRVSGVCILTYDISRRRQAEQALAKERFLMEALMEKIPDRIYFKDRESRFIRINRPMAKAFKLSDPEQAIGKTDFDFFLPEHARQAFEDEQQIILTGEALVGREEKETWPDGSVTWVSTTKMALRDKSGQIIGSFGISRDITDRKRAEDALAMKTQELVRSNAELEHFAYAASHDLQEPLRMIASYLQLLVRRCQDHLSEDGKEFIGFAVDGAKRMQNLINDLLLYSRVGRHGKPFVATECAETVQRALANLQIAIEDNQAVITQDPLPRLLADPSQLTQLFQNLIGNAIKFRREEPPAIHISAQYRAVTSSSLNPGAVGEWVFSVRDNGIGIEPQYYDRIFVIFQRLHTREQYPGTGIGLSLCKRIVERHGGRIWVESRPGEGSTFFFTISQPENAHG